MNIKTKLDSFAALRYKDFRSYTAIHFFFTFAYQMQVTVLGFYVYQITHSTLAIAYLGLSGAVPAIGIALYGGYIADKNEKRKMLIIIHLAMLISALVILVATSNSLQGYIHTNGIVLIIYAMVFCNGIGRAFYEPSMSSIYANSIPREVYANASNWNSTSWQAASILGPMAGGFIYAFANNILPGLNGISATFGSVVILLLISLVLVYRLRDYPATFIPKEKMWKSISEGVHFVFHNKMVLYAMSLDLFSVFFGGAVALLPVFAIDILKVGAEGLGIMRMAASLGGALTTVIMIRFSPMGKPWRNLLIAVGGFGIAIIGFGLSHNFLLSLVLLFAQGAFDSISVMIRGTLMQLLTPDEMRGRVSAVNSMFIGSSSEIGDVESGLAAKILGSIPAVIFGGSMTLLIVIFTYFRTKKMLNLSLSDVHYQNGSEG